MKFNVEVNGLFIDKSSDVSKIESHILKKIAVNMNEGSTILKKDISKVLGGYKSLGRLYRRPGGRIHVASLPGYPPNEDTGKLKLGVFFKRAKKTAQSVIESFIGVDPTRAGAKKDYAGYMEYGTRKIKPRPYFFDTIELSIRNENKGVGKIIRQIRATVANVLRAKALRPGRRRII